MNFTNKFGLPKPIVAALTYESYKKVGRISATGLLKPPRARVLEERHADEITEDVSDRIWSMFGTACHWVVEKQDSDEYLSETRLKVEANGWTVSGQMDLYEKSSGAIIDLKTTSAWSIVFPKPEWEQQLNIYAHLARENGMTVNALQIIAILRDWQRSKARDDGYPSAQVAVRNYVPWSPEKARKFFIERLVAHQAAENLGDDALPECSSEEKWARPTRYAVMKPGRKSAVRVFDTRHAADECANTVAGGRIEVRRGVAVRCNDYCNAAPFCKYSSKFKEVANDGARNHSGGR